MPLAPPAYSVTSEAVRVRHLGTLRGLAMTLARIAASLAVFAGLAGVADSIDGSSGAMFGLAMLAALAFALALVAVVPLGFMLAWSGFAALVARPRHGALSVGGGLFVEHGREQQWYASADVLAVEPLTSRAPGTARIRIEEGDTIDVVIAGADRRGAITAALAASGPRGLWATPLHAASLPSPWPRRVLTGLLSLAASLSLLLAHGSAAVASFAGCVGAVAWLTVLRIGPRRHRLRLGNDGIALRSEVATRFVPYARILEVSEAAYGADVVLDDGERLALAVVPPELVARDGMRAYERELALLRRAELLPRLRAAVHGVEHIAGAERLARQGRSIDAWRAAVREIVRQDAPGYRAALLPTEQAARIVESGHASPEARVGAALALADRADEVLKRRLRVAIEASADEHTRHAVADALEDRLEPWRVERLGRQER
jgi:hypothetical protein